MATTVYFAITDGTTTCTFADGASPPGATNYRMALAGWAPATTAIRRSPLGGRGPYETVVESFTVHVNGSSVNACLANLAALKNLLDQAERWNRNEQVSPVLVKYSPGGATVSSAAAPLNAIILGRAPGDQTNVNLPVDFDSRMLGTNKYVAKVQVRFWRTGLWLANTLDTQASGATNDGSLASITMAGAVSALSPTYLSATNVIVTGNYYYGGFLALTDTALGIGIYNAKDGAAGAWTSVVAGGGELSNSGNILRYTPAGTTESASAGIANGAGTFATGQRNIALFANIRNNSTTTSYLLRAALSKNGNLTYTPYIYIAPQASAYPKYYSLGTIAGNSIDYIFLYATASAASGTLDFDTVCMVDVTSATTSVIALPLQTNLTGTLVIDHHTYTPAAMQTKPDVTIATSPAVWTGDAFVTTSGGTLIGRLMLTGGAASPGNNWRSGTSNTWTAKRSTGYPIPT